ncbi:MAG: prepilin-type N-terminal cleavage/methylation domain-containing protein [Pseudomonadales bacterium]|nr:prepilin-type N-terminal cleavage/methylation domain-containing protein [Pseudomonadales bacterium]
MKRGKGFTLTEILIVLSIIAILSSIAYPSYQQHYKTVYRTEAKLALSAFAAAMDNHYSLQTTYITAAADNDGESAITSTTKPGIFPDAAPLDKTEKLYQLRIIEADAFHYVIQAIPITGKSMEEDGLLQLDSYGQQAWDKDSSGGIGDDEWCWDKSECA